MKRILRSLVFSLTGIAVIGASQQAFAQARKLQNGISEKFQVIYSHDRAYSISGGEVFEDTAVIIAHKNKYEAIID